MTTFIAAILTSSTWELIFATLFFFGLFFFIISMLGSLGDEDTEIGDDTDLDTDFDTDLDSDLDLDADTDIDLDADVGDELDFSDNTFDSIKVDSLDYDDEDKNTTIESRFKMGEYASFSMFTGMVGWFYSTSLTDQNIMFAIILGFIMSKLFGFAISKYASTEITPVKSIRRGDIAVVRHSVTPEKSGIVAIIRKDGVETTQMARGAFPHDSFSKGEKGYIWGFESGIYLITRGIRGQPDLNTEPKSQKKKALDI